MNLEKNSVLVDGLDCTYYSAGTGDPILFLHGGGADALTFSEHILALTEYGKVYAPDIPSCGETPTPKDIWNFSDYAKFFLQFINELKLKNLTVVGNSWGGGIAVHLALDNQNISKLILANTAGVRVEYSTLKFLFNFGIRKAINDIFMFRSLRDYVNIKNGAKRTLKNHKNDYWRNLKIIKTCLRQETPDLAQITAKTLILASSNDELFPLDHVKILRQKIPNSELKIFKGNHSWMTFRPNEFADAVKDFILTDQE